MLKVVTLSVGQLQSNCYLVTIEDSNAKDNPTLIIDPGDDADLIMQTLSDNKLKPIAMVATHGHFDHVMAAYELQQAYQIPFYINPKDKFLLERLAQTASHFLGENVVTIPPQKIDEINEKFEIRNSNIEKNILQNFNSQIKIIYVPGHTPGSVAIYFPKAETVFVGDLIFASGGYGRTDFSYCSFTDLKNSISKILKLRAQTQIYCGHGETTSVADERKFY